eukprot:4321048-Alexandrium_andersonii.AAC.1
MMMEQVAPVPLPDFPEASQSSANESIHPEPEQDCTELNGPCDCDCCARDRCNCDCCAWGVAIARRGCGCCVRGRCNCDRCICEGCDSILA